MRQWADRVFSSKHSLGDAGSPTIGGKQALARRGTHRVALNGVDTIAEAHRPHRRLLNGLTEIVTETKGNP